MGKVGDASLFWVWGSRAFVRDTSVYKLSTRAIPCVFLRFPLGAPSWQFYHPTSRCVLPPQDVTFDESVPFYCLFPYRSAPLPPPPLFLAPGPLPVDPLPPQGPPPPGVSQVDPLPGTVPVEVAVDSGVARGAASGGAEPASAEPWGAEPAGAEPGGAEPEGVEPGGAEPRGAELGGAESESAESAGADSRGTSSAGGPADASPRLRAAGAGGSAAGGTRAGATGLGGAGVPTAAGGTGAADPGIGGGGGGGTGTGFAGAGDFGAGAGGAGAGGAGARDLDAGGAGAGGTRAGDPGGGGAGARGAGAGGTSAGGTVQWRLFFVPPPLSSLPPPDSVLRQFLSLPSSTGLPPSLLSPPPRQSQPQLQPDSPLPAPSPYAEQTHSFTERHEPESRPTSPACTIRSGRRVPRLRPPPISGMHVIELCPSSVPLRVPLPPPPKSSLPAVPDPEPHLAHDASPTVPRLLATVVTDPSFDSTAASALVAELVDFTAVCRL
ncbi:unnamed protein product [Closterium sp. NIES-53]